METNGGTDFRIVDEVNYPYGQRRLYSIMSVVAARPT
jgi:hypothetical protein